MNDHGHIDPEVSNAYLRAIHAKDTETLHKLFATHNNNVWGQFRNDITASEEEWLKSVWMAWMFRP